MQPWIYEGKMEIYTKSLKGAGVADVLVVGSGSAGATAALTAARLGASVILIERYGFMGGISTQVLDTFYGFYTPGSAAKKVVGGIPDLVVDELTKREMAILRPNTYGAGQGITYDPETLKVVWETLAIQAGVRLLYHTFVIDVLQEAERVYGVVAAGKGGLVRLEAEVVIDASGDADLAAAAGVPFEGAKDGPVQSLTTTFRVINVDVERARQVKKAELHELMQEAIQSGGYQLPRKEGSVHITPLEGVMATNMTRVGQIDATDPEQLTLAEVEGRKQAMEYFRFLRDKVPGYEKAALSWLSHQVGVRESRRIFGKYRLTREDVLAGRKFDDAIAQCGAPIEDHHAGDQTRWEYLADGDTYQIPYRCLLPQSVEGLLVAGRCLSADHDAHASVRSMGQCMAMGQAAGAAGALASAQGIPPSELPIEKLQSRLREIGALF
jgi:glycine/D-amino acid oxidase-like deaminating enzyme